MPRSDDDAPAYLDDVHQDIAEFAARHLDEDEREDFVDSLLERKGYQRQSIWAAPEPEGGQGKRPLVKPSGQGGQGKSGKPSYFGSKTR